MYKRSGHVDMPGDTGIWMRLSRLLLNCLVRLAKTSESLPQMGIWAEENLPFVVVHGLISETGLYHSASYR
jgi:hypothetical protein